MIDMPLVITHSDYHRLRSLLDSMPVQDRQHYQDLRNELERARRVEADHLPEDVVSMGATVRLVELDSGETWTFTLSYPGEADIRQNRISILAPVGTAIIGCRVGDIVDWPVPSGVVRIRIEAVDAGPSNGGRSLPPLAHTNARLTV